ncbi:MAG: hypothetical protein IPP83_09525 [Flavobacteriales bacterium]|nr:hypothetical protein [Flavobacteriales bacterium]
MRSTACIVLGCCCALAYAQGFNVVNLPANNAASRGASVRQVSEGYLVFGDKYDADLVYRAHVELHGSDGALIWERALVDAAPSAFGYVDPVSPTVPDGGWAASIALNGTDTMTWRAYRFDAEGDTLWTTSLRTGYRVYPRAAVCQGDAYYYAALVQQHGSEVTKAVVARLNVPGELVQLVEFPTIAYDNLTLAAGTGTDLLMVGGRSGSSFPYRSVVMRLDSALNVIWTRDILTNMSGFSGYSSYVSKITTDEDGDVLVGGTCYNEFVSSGIPYAEFYILKLSRVNGNVIWTRRYPVSMSDWGSLNDLEHLPDGDMVSCGNVTPHDAAGFQGCIYRYAPDGTERWHRYYRFLTNPDAFNDLKDVQPTTDGGFVLTGTTQLTLQFPTVLWLLRLDEHGCLEPGCQSVGVNELLVGLPDDAMRCGPVPARDLLTVTINLPPDVELSGTMRLVATDQAGRVVQETILPDRRSQEMLIQVDTWGAGMYVIHLADQARLLASRKIMVQ